MEMAGIEAKQLAPRDGITQVELVGANRATLRTEPE
jgi:hypothetical protein